MRHQWGECLAACLQPPASVLVTRDALLIPTKNKGTEMLPNIKPGRLISNKILLFPKVKQIRG